MARNTKGLPTEPQHYEEDEDNQRNDQELHGRDDPNANPTELTEASVVQGIREISIDATPFCPAKSSDQGSEVPKQGGKKSDNAKGQSAKTKKKCYTRTPSQTSTGSNKTCFTFKKSENINIGRGQQTNIEIKCGSCGFYDQPQPREQSFFDIPDGSSHSTKVESYSFTNSKGINVGDGFQRNFTLCVDTHGAPREPPFSSPQEPPPASPEQEVPIEIQNSDRRIEDNDMLLIASRLGNNWIQLSRRLRGYVFQQADIDEIKVLYPYDGLQEWSYQLLLRWKQRAPNCATIGNLAVALIRINMSNIALILNP